MYKVSVPVVLTTLEKYGTDGYIKAMREMGAERIMISIGSYITDPHTRMDTFLKLKKNCALLHAAGFEVGVWLWTFMIQGDQEYTHITSPYGQSASVEVCPSDEAFCSFAASYLADIATCDPDLILFDDDFRYGHLDCGLGCTCQNHLTYMSELLQEKLTLEGLPEKLLSGKQNRYRSAWLKANGYYFRLFAEKMRIAVDSVNPSIRMGLCACMTTWDFDGVSAAELSRILAGGTKPFLRLIGAPYWAPERNWGNRLQDVIELERMERSWCGEGIEIVSEGDSYPRPRFVCPASYVEGFDMALRASGNMDGILKYVFDYYASPSYESGYVHNHIQNMPIYQQIETCFANKITCGIRVYEHMTKFENMDIPQHLTGSCSVQDMFFSPSARLLAACSIPSVYEGLGIGGIAFGENVKYLEDGALDNGLILDVTAAQILNTQGIDTGILGTHDIRFADEEYYVQENEYVFTGNAPFHDISVNQNAKILSYFVSKGCQYPASYLYKNTVGQRFLVYSFDGYTTKDHVTKQYARARQITENISWLSRKILPAVLSGNPDLYMLTKKNDHELAVWIGNFFADAAYNTTIVLDKVYLKIKFINCVGELSNNTVVLHRIDPFNSVGFVVSS